MLAQRECSKATELNPIASSKSIPNGVKDGVHDLFEIMSRQMRTMLGELSDQLELDQFGGILRCGVALSEGCRSTE
jgi:hypothetical protein